MRNFQDILRPAGKTSSDRGAIVFQNEYLRVCSLVTEDSLAVHEHNEDERHKDRAASVLSEQNRGCKVIGNWPDPRTVNRANRWNSLTTTGDPDRATP